MITTLTIVRYPKWMGWAGVISMAVFRLPLSFGRGISFWKLLGCGRNGTFDKTPDWRQWAVLLVGDPGPEMGRPQTPGLLLSWWKCFHCEVCTLVLEPIEGHGTWDGKACFGNLGKQATHEGITAVLTRATIRPGKMKDFWKNVDAVASRMAVADGFISSLGIGELPLLRQATFSIWETKTALKKFAYQGEEHAAVIRRTRLEKWYSEDMFVRFIIRDASGTIAGKSPLERKA